MIFYKYYPPSSHSFIITDKGLSLRFSQISTLNDEFELSTRTSEMSDDFIAKIFLSSKHPNAIKELIKFLALNEEDKEDFKKKLIIEEIKRTKESHDKNIGILSLSMNNNSKNLWAYYAKDLSGFMIEIDINENSLNFPTIHGKVNYSKELPDSLIYKIFKGELNTPEKIANYFSYILLNKHENWSNEEEYRFTGQLSEISHVGYDSNKKPLHCHMFPYEVLKGVYFGPRVDNNIKDAITQQIKKHYPSTKLYHSKPSPDSYDMLYIEIP